MTEPLAFKDGIQFAWDATSIKLAEECLRKYQLQMIEGWKSANESVHLRFGSHYATALEHFYKHRATGASFDEAVLEVVTEAMIETWDHERSPEGERIPETGTPYAPPVDAPGSARLKTRENLIRTIVWYFEQFREDTAEVVMLANGKPAVEYSFKLPVDNDIVFSGHIDRLVTYADNIMVMDQKTSGSTITSRYFDGFNPDVQMSMYTFAGKAIYQMPVRGVIIDAAQIAVGFTRFERGLTFRTDGQLSEWYDTSMYTIESARSATRLNYFPMNRTSCDKFGGCPFRPVCSRDPNVREQYLNGLFVRGERWDPLRAR